MLVGETCAHCGLVATERVGGYDGNPDQAIDPCLGQLPDTIHACCGHGGASKPYVVIAPGHPPGTSCEDIDDFGLWDEDTALQFFEFHGKGLTMIDPPPGE